MTIYDVEPTDFIEELAKELIKIESIEPPEWAPFVKTGAHKERPPAREDWWYVRAAAVLRKIRLKGPIGVSKLRNLYGGKKNRGYAPERFKKGSGNIIRKVLQQLEKAELVKQDSKGVHKGRIITAKGIKLMDNLATKIAGPKKIIKKSEIVKKEDRESAKKKEAAPVVKKEEAEQAGKSPESSKKKSEKKETKLESAEKKEAAPVVKKEEAEQAGKSPESSKKNG